jgi:hypothetical protein
MPKYNLAHANDEEEQDDFELVGSKDLRESFNERNGRLRGSFSVNGYELHNFEANTPANLVALLNAKSNYTHVQAQIDDGGHLVLTGNGPTPIRIAQGAAFVEPPPVSGSGDAADQVLQKLKTAADKDASKGEDGQPKNTILEDLGLEATPEDGDKGQAVQPGFETGLSAEDRKKQREAIKRGEVQPGQMFSTAPGGSSPSAGTAGMTDRVPTEQSAPITGSADGAKMADGRDRTGQGAGYSTKPDGTPPVVGTPARNEQQGGLNDPAANVPHRPNPQSP